MLSEAWRVAYGERKSPSALLCLIFSLVVQRLRINQRFLVKHQGSLTQAILIALSLSYCFFSHPSSPSTPTLKKDAESPILPNPVLLKFPRRWVIYHTGLCVIIMHD